MAQKLGRRWIEADINKSAIQTTEKRLAAIIREQIAVGGEQLTLDDDTDAPPRPAQTSFTVRRVHDYDLQIQHNEALELAVEHLGVQRTRADTFFVDGTYDLDAPAGDRLAAIRITDMLGEEILVVENRTGR